MGQTIIQPASADSLLYEFSGDTNYSDYEYISVNNYNDGTQRGILKFDSSVISKNKKILQAYLGLYYYAKGGGPDPEGLIVKANRITQTSWVNADVCWNHYSGTTHWATEGGDFIATDAASLAVPADFGWMSWDITNQVNYARLNVSNIVHLLVKYDEEDKAIAASTQLKFYSSDYTGDTSLCPKLVINWQYKNPLWFGHA